ncbi:MAG: SIR2 family protein, partial [Anaerolineales bacterium]|nr:SIR2 family protein [Anaerolineales bacterium]
FLGKFDAIFSINQDILIERQYHGDDRAFTHHPKFSKGPSIPGMHHHSQSDRPERVGWAHDTWTPMTVPEQGFIVEPDTQPFFKLHGSSNWRCQSGDDLLIIGGNKTGEIKSNPVLNWYQEMFDNYLCAPDTRLMVIGYGFRDIHINKVIQKGVEAGTKFFVVDPCGSSLAKANRLQPAGSLQESLSNLEGTFRKGLIGASRRTLRSIFSGNDVEFRKVQSFFT